MATEEPVFIEGQPFDMDGNPLIRAGCPNCGKGSRLVSQIEFAAASNSGRDLAGPCSSVCRSQLEYAKELAERKRATTDGETWLAASTGQEEGPHGDD
jgi:predicted  nucleic acid-binding Zn-ribbon protein